MDKHLMTGIWHVAVMMLLYVLLYCVMYFSTIMFLSMATYSRDSQQVIKCNKLINIKKRSRFGLDEEAKKTSMMITDV